MKYAGKIQDPLDLVTKEYVDNHYTAGSGIEISETGEISLTTTGDKVVQVKSWTASDLGV